MAALLERSTHLRAPLTHAMPAPTDQQWLTSAVSRVSPILTHSRFRRSSTYVSGVSDVSLVGVSLLSADVAVVVVKPDVIHVIQQVWYAKVEQGLAIELVFGT